MPIPKPEARETEDKYISRCISEIGNEYDIEGQAYAVCKSTYDKDKMSKMTDTSSKVMASVVYNTRFKGINLLAKGDDPCWDGYEMIGMKDDGTPNCVPVKLAEGVPHYTKDGELYTGPTHKDASGRLMTGEVHTEDSEFLYHKEDLAEVGPRGGIKESPKAPKSDTKNPNPKGEGSAKGDASSTRGAKVTAEQEKTLENKVKEFNERESNTKNGNATLGALKSVFQRGLGAFNTSHSPRVQSAEQWAYARVNAFLYLLKNGRPENPKYDTDFDLLPKGHPKSNK